MHGGAKYGGKDPELIKYCLDMSNISQLKKDLTEET